MASYIIDPDEIYHLSNKDLRNLFVRAAELAVQTKMLQKNVSKFQEKKKTYKSSHRCEFKTIEKTLGCCEKEMKNLLEQYNLVNQKNEYHKKNILLRIQHRQDIKKYKDLKERYYNHCDLYQKKIKELENIIEEKTKTVDLERESKRKLQKCVKRMQKNASEKEIVKLVYKEAQPNLAEQKEKIRSTALKLVLKGQTKIYYSMVLKLNPILPSLIIIIIM